MVKQKMDFGKTACFFGVLFLLGPNIILSFGESQTNTSPVNSSNFVRKNLLDCIGDVPLWYDECLHYTAWPDEKKLVPLKEVPDMRYSYETLINEVMREGLLDKAWREKVVRVKAWIPERSLGRSVDAYLYRQVVDSGTLHICDTRTALVVAFLADKNQPFEDEPRKFLEQVVQKLFQIKLPSEYEFRKQDDRFFTGFSLFNDKGIPPDVQKRVASKLIGTNSGPSSFSLAYISGARLAIFWLTKDNVSGCRLDRRYPLFRKVSATAYPGELVLEKLKDFEKPLAKDIPELLKMLSSLPKMSSSKQLTNPYETNYLWNAKIGIVKALTIALKSIEAGGHKEVELIKEALKAVRYIQHAEENPQRWHVIRLKEAAVEALHRIGSDEAAKLHFKMIDREKDRDFIESLSKGLPKYPLFREGMERDWKQAKAEGKDISRYELYQNLRSRMKKEARKKAYEKRRRRLRRYP